MTMRKLIVTLAVLLCSGTAWAGSAADAWKKYKGRIFVSAAEIPTVYASDKEMVDTLKKLAGEVAARG